MRVSVVVPTRNRCKDLNRCLGALLKQTYRDFEIVVIDNGSTDQTPGLLQKYPAKVIRTETKNLAHVFNLGWKNASGDVIAFLNDDAEPLPNWLEKSVETFKFSAEAGIVGGPTIALSEQQIYGTYKRFMKSKMLKPWLTIYNKVILDGKLLGIGVLCESGAFSIGGSLQYSARTKDIVDVDILTITNMAVKREVLEKLCGFDENFMYSSIDGDFFVRAKRARYKLLFNPGAVVLHHVNPTGATRSPFYLGRDYAYFLLKDIRPKSFRGWLSMLLNIILFNAFWLYEMYKQRRLSSLQGIRGFLCGVRDYLHMKRYLFYRAH